MSPEIEPFWQAFLATVPESERAQTRFYDAFYFNDHKASADELAELVLKGEKGGTASLLWSYEADGDPLPEPGYLGIVTNWDGAPLCIVETTHVEVVPFENVSEDFARAEGEGDKTLRYWQEVHERYFSRVCKSLGRVPKPTMPVVCERFKVVYP